MTKLLLADDHDLVREMIAAYLRAQGGFEVHVAESLGTALDVQEKQNSLRYFDYHIFLSCIFPRLSFESKACYYVLLKIKLLFHLY